jgi:hypothetical protein
MTDTLHLHRESFDVYIAFTLWLHCVYIEFKYIQMQYKFTLYLHCIYIDNIIVYVNTM